MHFKERLDTCEARVNSRSHTTEECTEELFDFLHARDHCVSVLCKQEHKSVRQSYRSLLARKLQDPFRAVGVTKLAHFLPEFITMVTGLSQVKYVALVQDENIM